jgi:hypothetical protein
VDDLSRGLSDAEIDTIIEPLGYGLPEEARRWWRWHNGSLVPRHQVLRSRTFTPLEHDVAATLSADRTLPDWPAGRLRILSGRPQILVDCHGAVDQPTRIWHFDVAYDEPIEMFPSFGDMVQFWIELIDRGHMTWDREAQLWRLAEDLPESVSHRLWGAARP